VILGVGVDLCPVNRIEGILARHGELFSNRVFTENEMRYAGRFAAQGERLAARFAAKEATIKALGGPSGLRWRDMEVCNEEDGAPRLELRGGARAHADALGVRRAWISLSHAGGMAMAMVVLEGGSEHVE
jgi:holo-[acyl-carrier protein] synthase